MGKCGATAKVVTQAKGTTRLTCTLPEHEGDGHYDEAFSMRWKGNDA